LSADSQNDVDVDVDEDVDVGISNQASLPRGGGESGDFKKSENIESKLKGEKMAHIEKLWDKLSFKKD